jgi:hypothetical protein
VAVSVVRVIFTHIIPGALHPVVVRDASVAVHVWFAVVLIVTVESDCAALNATSSVVVPSSFEHSVAACRMIVWALVASVVATSTLKLGAVAVSQSFGK